MGQERLEEVGQRSGQQELADVAGKALRVAVLVPSQNGFWPAKFCGSLSNMVIHFQGSEYKEGDHDITVISKSGPVMPEVRHRLIGDAMAWEATHILMISPELTFPADSIHRMLKRGRGVVAVNYLKNFISQDFSAYRAGSTVKPDPVLPETEEVDGVSIGMALFCMPVFDVLELPYFKHEQIEDTPAFTEDHIFFWEKCKEKEIPCIIDHELSQEIKSLHHGEIWH